MNLPKQAHPIIRRAGYGCLEGGITPSCAPWTSVKCAAEFTGVAAAAAAAETGVGAVAAAAGAVGFIADCHDCIADWQMDSICGPLHLANSIVNLGPAIAGACRGHGGF